MTDVIILTEAGGSVGYGHLTRCAAIASHMNVDLYVHSDGDYPSSKNCKKFNWRTQAGELINRLSAQCSILVDSYLADRHIYELFSNYFDHVSVIDDYDRIEYPVDLIINPGIVMPEYRNQAAKIVGGHEYIILRDEIIRQVKKKDYIECKNLLITFGGCGASDILDWLIPVFSSHSYETITIITGNNEIGKILPTKFSDSSISWIGKIDADKMAQLMYQADICISAGGQTLHELAYIGVPTICIETGVDQKNNIEGYINAGFLLENLSLETNEISHRVTDLLKVYSSPEIRQRVAENGKNMVDGQGAQRIVEHLQFSLS